MGFFGLVFDTNVNCGLLVSAFPDLALQTYAIHSWSMLPYHLTSCLSHWKAARVQIPSKLRVSVHRMAFEDCEDGVRT